MSKLWKITNPKGTSPSYRENAEVAEYYRDRGYEVEEYVRVAVPNDDYREKGSPIFNVSLTEENCGAVLSDMLMECAERLGNFPEAQVDERAWKHILMYAPIRLRFTE
jgi:hypothetical protein